MRILVVGGSYFIGARLVQVCLQRGDEVVVLNRGSRTLAYVEQILADRDDALQMSKVLRGRTFDAVFDTSVYNARQATSLIAALDPANRNVIMLSTAAVYSDAAKLPSTEDSPVGHPNGWGQYSLDKRSAEEAYLHSAIPATILRAPYVYGAGSYLERESKLWHDIVRGKEIGLVARGSLYAQFIHVDDLVQAMLLCAQRQSGRHRVYNVASGPPITHGDFVQLLASIAGVAARTLPADLDDAQEFPFTAVDVAISDERIRQELGYEPHTALADGMEEALCQDGTTPGALPVSPSRLMSLHALLGASRAVGEVEFRATESGTGVEVYVTGDPNVARSVISTNWADESTPYTVNGVSSIALGVNGDVDVRELRKSAIAGAGELVTTTTAKSEPSARSPIPRQLEARVNPSEPSWVVGSQTKCKFPFEDLRGALEHASRAYSDNGVLAYGADGTARFLPYGELYARAKGYADWLLQRCSPGDIAILVVGEPQDCFPLFWGCVLAGIVPAPVGVDVLDRDPARFWAIAKVLENPWVVSDAAQRRRVELELKDHPVISQRILVPACDAQPGDAHRLPERSRASESLILLTSGSTGLPKGVPLTADIILARTAASVDLNGCSRNDITLNWLPLDHICGLVMCHIHDLCVGAYQIHVATPLVMSNPRKWLDLLSEHRVTHTWAANFAFAEVVRSVEQSGGPQWDLTHVRAIINAGEPINSRIAADFLERLAPYGLRSTAMSPAWGMSETCSAVVQSYEFNPNSDCGDTYCNLGVVYPDTEIRIVNDDGQVVPEGITGHLEARGKTVISRYFGPNDVSKGQFTADGWLKTGDTAFIAGKRLVLAGRTKDIVIVNGQKFSCQEIESAASSICGVQRGSVAACPVRHGDTESYLLFLSTSMPIHEYAQLLRSTRETMIRTIGLAPADVFIVKPASVPRTGIGKVRRAELLKMHTGGEILPLAKLSDVDANCVLELTWEPRKTNLVPRAQAMSTTAFIVEQYDGIAANFLNLISRGDPRLVIETGSLDITSTSGAATLKDLLRAHDVRTVVYTTPYSFPPEQRQTAAWLNAEIKALTDTLGLSGIRILVVDRSCESCPLSCDAYAHVIESASAAACLVSLAGPTLESDAFDVRTELCALSTDRFIRYTHHQRTVPALRSSAGSGQALGDAYRIVACAELAGDIAASLSERVSLFDDRSTWSAGSLIAALPVPAEFGGATPTDVRTLHAFFSETSSSDIRTIFVSGCPTAHALLSAAEKATTTVLLQAAPSNTLERFMRRAERESRDNVTEQLTSLWSQVLGLRALKPDDNLFGAGADSLRVQRFVSSANSNGLAITVHDVFQRQTIRELALMLNNHGDYAPPPAIEATSAEIANLESQLTGSA